MGDCVPTPTDTRFATEVDTTTLGTTTLLRQLTSVSVETGSFPSTICDDSGSKGCSVITITYRITSTSTTFVPTATSTIISRITNIVPQQTLFAPCTTADDSPSPPPLSPSPSRTRSSTRSSDTSTPSNNVSTSLSQSSTTLPNGDVSVTSVYVTVVPSGQSQDDSSRSSNTNRAAVIGGTISAVVVLSIIGFLMWILWRKNRAMKAALAEHERKEDEVNMAQLLPTPYPFTSSPPGPYAVDTTSSPTPRSPSSYGYSSAYAHQQGVPGLPIASLYSKSPSTDPESDSTTNDMYTHTRTHSLRPSTAGSQTQSIAMSQPPGPSGVITSGHPPEHRRMSVGAQSKAREALMERRVSIPDGPLRAVNITDEVEGDPAHPPSAWIPPPPAYSREAQ